MNRFRLMIVDDEAMIRQGMTKLIEKKAPGWTVAGEARNGQEALDLLGRVEPHLVLTDIRMPMMDGIELARTLHEHNPDVAVVILTGFKDFEYAQAALRYGVLDFLLKPCPEEDVIRVLDAVYGKLSEKLARKESEMHEAHLLDQNTLRSIMLRLPYGRERMERVEQRVLNKELWLIKAASYFPKTKSYGYNDLGLLQFSITNIAEELIAGGSPQSGLLHAAYDIFAVFADPEEPADRLLRELESTVERLLGIRLEIRHAGRVESLRQLPVFMEAFASRYDSLPESGLGRLAVDRAKIRNIRHDIMSAIMLGQAEKLSEYVDGHIAALRRLPAEAARSEALALALALDETVRKEFESDAGRADFDSRIDRLRKLGDSGEAADWAAAQKASFLAELHRWLDGQNQTIIGKAIRYIEEHYTESCDLKEVADHVHLSANYFSNLFRKETGESFVNYVTRLRIDKAKLWLAHTEWKVFEVAQKVGYDDPNYFTTVFKQLTNLSPSQYRKKVREGQTP